MRLVESIIPLIAALALTIVLVHSPCSPCLRGDKSAENHFTTKNTENPLGREIRTLPVIDGYCTSNIPRQIYPSD